MSPIRAKKRLREPAPGRGPGAAPGRARRGERAALLLLALGAAYVLGHLALALARGAFRLQ